MVSVAAVLVALAVACAVRWVLLFARTGARGGLSFHLKPPPPNTCGSPGGPPVTSPRVRTRDGRYLAYRESGAPRHQARWHVVAVHGFGASKDEAFPPLSLEVVEGLGVCVLSYDRAGYGESDPNPGRTGNDEAMDVQDLADALLGPGRRFHLIGVSLGGYVAWACIKHIPHRLAGVAMVAPGVSFWWSSFPPSVASSGFRKLTLRDRITFSIARHFPSLLYAWMTQRIVTPSAIATPGPNGTPNPAVMSRRDTEMIRNKMNQLAAAAARGSNTSNGASSDIDGLCSKGRISRALQQGPAESIFRDMVMIFAETGFDPMQMGDEDPLKMASAENDAVAAGGVQVWQGGEDRIVPAEMQRYVAAKLPWVRYREFPDLGHMFLGEPGWADRIVNALLMGQLSHQ